MLIEPWLYRPDQPQLAAYSTRLANAEALPLLDESLHAIGEYQRRLHANQAHALLLLVHGLDASGKDSLVRAIATYMDPAGFKACK